MEILITGAAGMIGRKLIARLAAEATIGDPDYDVAEHWDRHPFRRAV